jgi:hypothetical protein
MCPTNILILMITFENWLDKVTWWHLDEANGEGTSSNPRVLNQLVVASMYLSICCSPQQCSLRDYICHLYHGMLSMVLPILIMCFCAIIAVQNV